MLRFYKNSHGILRSQLKYIIIGTIIGYTGGITNYFLWYRIPIPPFGNISASFYILCVAYAIIRYRLMDIRIVLRKIVIYFLSATFVYGIFFFLVWMFETYFSGVFTSGTYLAGLIIAPLFVIILLRLYSLIQRVANKYLFFSLYSSQETMAKLTDELTNSIDLSKIVDSIVNSIKQAMQLDRAGILLIDQNDGTINPVRNSPPAGAVSNGVKYKTAKVVGFNENNGISLVQDNFLTQYLQKTQKPLVRDELQMIAKDLSSAEEKQSFNQLAENMKRIEALLCLPMIISNRLIGIIVLGSKVSGDAYTNEDLTLLNTLSKQAAIAVDNARLYREVRDFSKTLQQKVDEQTKEIKHAYEVEKKAHNDLKQLDEAKTNFMLVTQHHLRTPLSVNKGFLSLLMGGRYGKIPPKIKNVILELDASTEKEIKTVNELLDISSYQLGHGYIQVKPGIPIKSLLEEITNDLRPLADNNKIYLKFENKGAVPDITADEKQLKMALQNIVDNAVKYTRQGGVTVKLESENDKIKIEVKDTGIGMDEEDKKHLFEKPFQRSKEAWTANAIGKGIGLYLSAQIIKAHGGRIWAESNGLEKGSAFYIELPISITNTKINK